MAEYDVRNGQYFDRDRQEWARCVHETGPCGPTCGDVRVQMQGARCTAFCLRGLGQGGEPLVRELALVVTTEAERARLDAAVERAVPPQLMGGAP